MIDGVVRGVGSILQEFKDRLFEELADTTVTFTYARRIWQFFQGLLEISIQKIFELFQIEDDFHSRLFSGRAH